MLLEKAKSLKINLWMWAIQLLLLTKSYWWDIFCHFSTISMLQKCSFSLIRSDTRIRILLSHTYKREKNSRCLYRSWLNNNRYIALVIKTSTRLCFFLLLNNFFLWYAMVYCRCYCCDVYECIISLCDTRDVSRANENIRNETIDMMPINEEQKASEYLVHFFIETIDKSRMRYTHYMVFCHMGSIVLLLLLSFLKC